MSKIQEILNSLEKKYHILPIWNIFDSEHNTIKRMGLKSNIDEKSLYIGSGRTFIDIPVGIGFDVIFPLKDPKKYEKIESILEKIKLNSSQDIDYLPQGIAGICLIKFKNERPDILELVPPYSVKFNAEFHDVLYLTTQNALDEFIELIAKDQQNSTT